MEDAPLKTKGKKDGRHKSVCHLFMEKYEKQKHLQHLVRYGAHSLIFRNCSISVKCDPQSPPPRNANALFGGIYWKHIETFSA